MQEGSLEIVKGMKQKLCYVLKISVLVSVVQLVFKDRQQKYYYYFKRQNIKLQNCEGNISHYFRLLLENIFIITRLL